MADIYAPEYYDDMQAGRPGVVLHRSVKRDISDTTNSDNYLAVSGDKYYLFKLPKHSRVLGGFFTTKNIDTNAVPTTTISLVIHDGTTAHTFAAAQLTSSSGAVQYRVLDAEAMGDLLDVADCDVYLLAGASAATAGTSGVEVAASITYSIERAGSDPA